MANHSDGTTREPEPNRVSGHGVDLRVGDLLTGDGLEAPHRVDEIEDGTDVFRASFDVGLNFRQHCPGLIDHTLRAIAAGDLSVERDGEADVFDADERFMNGDGPEVEA